MSSSYNKTMLTLYWYLQDKGFHLHEVKGIMREIYLNLDNMIARKMYSSIGFVEIKEVEYTFLKE